MSEANLPEGRILLVEENFVNETEHCRFGDSEPYEPYTDDIGRLFRNMQKEYGRCTGYVYIDKDGTSYPIGWVFEKKMLYEDARSHNGAYREKDYYTRTVWVTLYVGEDPRGPEDRQYARGTGWKPGVVDYFKLKLPWFGRMVPRGATS